MDLEYDSAGRIHECGFISQFYLHDDRQLRTYSLRAPEVEPHSIRMVRSVHDLGLTYVSPFAWPTFHVFS